MPRWELPPVFAWLRKAYRSGSSKDREAARAEFIRPALLYSHGQLESLRAHFLEACYALTDALGETAFDPAQAGELGDLLEERLLAASSRQDLLPAFQDGLDRIAGAGDRPAEGKRLARMEEVKHYVDRHFTGPLRLKDLAPKAGLSRPAFLKGFRRTVGQGFSRYLQRLLRTSPISVERVAQESGFNSASYFVQSFKRATGLTPGAYRGGERPGGRKKI